MTKLEEKLIELGYEKEPEYNSNQYVFIYFKMCIGTANPIVIFYDSQCNVIYPQGIRFKESYISKQEQIYVLQQTFKEFEKDLEILKECESN